MSFPIASTTQVSRRIDGRDLFKSGYDKGRYLRRLNYYAALYGVKVHAYCILENHIHVIFTPATSTGLAQLFGWVLGPGWYSGPEINMASNTLRAHRLMVNQHWVRSSAFPLVK